MIWGARSWVASRKGCRASVIRQRTRPASCGTSTEAQTVQPWVAHIAGDDDRAVVEEAFRRHRLRCSRAPAPALCRGAHHDANDHNVLTPANGTGPAGAAISGLIDFGDMLYARQVNELAVTLAYALLDTTDLVAAGRDVISGYVGEFPLTDDELRIVYDLAATRLAMSVAISSHRSHEFPRTSTCCSQAPALRLLRRMMGMRPSLHFAAACEAAGLTRLPCSTTASCTGCNRHSATRRPCCRSTCGGPGE